MHHASLGEIRAAAKKAENFWYSTFYTCSSLVVWLGVRLGATPNQLTLAGASVNTVAAVGFLFSSGQPRHILLALTFFAGAHVLDCADGHLAFVSDQRSERGRWLDATCDVFKGALVTACFFKLLMLHEFSSLGGAGASARNLALCVAMGVPINYAILLHANLHRESVDPYRVRPLEAKRLNWLLRSAVSHSGEYGNFLLGFALFSFNSVLALFYFIIYETLNISLAAHRIYRVTKLIPPSPRG